MNITSTEISENNLHIQSQERQNHIFTEIFSLQQTELVLSHVERMQLKLIPKKYDTSHLQEKLAKYNECRVFAPEEAAAIELQLTQDLHLWRLTLAQRDARITAFQLRRFCEESTALNGQSIAALACFYRNILPSFEARSKFDYAVTQMFTVTARTGKRTVRISREDLIEHLQKLNAAWTGQPCKNFNGNKSREDAVAIFEALTVEANSHTKLEDLLKSEFFKRFRRHKQYLGDTFFVPEVTAASVFCNVTVGNKFDELVAAENEHLQTVLATEFGGTVMWKAALEDNPNRSQQILEHLVPSFTEQNSAELRVKARDSEFSEIEKNISNLGESAETAMYDDSEKLPESAALDAETISTNELTSPQFDHTANDAQNPNESEETSFHVSENRSEAIGGEVGQMAEFEAAKNFDEPEFDEIPFQAIAAELTKSNPNKNVLSDYLKTSPSAELRKFDLTPFFADEEIFESKPVELELRRKVMRFVLQAEDFCRRKRRVNSPENTPNGNEIDNLIEEMQLLGNNLRLAISEVTGEHKQERSNALLTISNYLLEARLRLSSLNAKSSGNISSQVKAEEKSKVHPPLQVRKTPVEFVKNVSPVRKSEKQSPVSSSFGVDGKLLIALAIVIVLAIGVFLVNPFAVEVGNDPNNPVKTLDLAKVRGGDNLTIATVNSSEMFGVVKSDWNSLSPEQKNESVIQLLGSGKDNNFTSLTLLDSSGKIVARASEKEIKIN